MGKRSEEDLTNFNPKPRNRARSRNSNEFNERLYIPLVCLQEGQYLRGHFAAESGAVVRAGAFRVDQVTLGDFRDPGSFPVFVPGFVTVREEPYLQEKKFILGNCIR